eukprot:CAMPEP_0175981260 /NCGR_PEP_ID=MMETSP0108-20121206/47235_1 /TAXON_ID=195067 ORGANISM="Goniomonas pacifica, Strain CCMP1869" /NCGR_SAMPLE_ID=MMETSP0108 /ASSEMBLY_ACC=CAM_ASM_000204 /LENGTH=78 /DNA_ID=CAMNT_0017311767 /DNA_START=8 /DNA_END=244 /DNA_ORIENTATION=-
MTMDLRGQKYCEIAYHVIIITFAVVGFALGWFLESFRVSVYAVLAGVALAMAICVPDWGIFRPKKPLVWLAPPPEATS